MNNTMETITKIEKEIIPTLSFKKEEVLSDLADVTKRKLSLAKALTLGNGQKRKVKIFFELEKGEQNSVETTVWAVGEEFVTLKAGALIPVHAISEIEF